MRAATWFNGCLHAVGSWKKLTLTSGSRKITKNPHGCCNLTKECMMRAPEGAQHSGPVHSPTRRCMFCKAQKTWQPRAKEAGPGAQTLGKTAYSNHMMNNETTMQLKPMGGAFLRKAA